MWIFQWMALVAVVSSAHSLTIVFLNGFHGYFILKIKAADWIVVSFFSTVVIYLPGALIVPCALVAGNVFLKDFRDWTKVSSMVDTNCREGEDH